MLCLKMFCGFLGVFLWIWVSLPVFLEAGGAQDPAHLIINLYSLHGQLVGIVGPFPRG